MDYADLHIHSIYSDGRLSVQEIIDYAVDLKLKAVSITDHDTIESIKTIPNTLPLHLEIIPGIELSTIYKEEEIHILGYYFNSNNETLNILLENLQEHRNNRAMKMINKLNELGLRITKEDIDYVFQGKAIGRPHIAQIIVNKRYASSFDEAFNKYLIPGTKGYVSKFKLSIQEAIDSIKAAGGIPVLAHPALIKDQSLIKELLNLDIEGIEVYHSKHNSQDIRDYYHLARDKKLLITGGSDCHSNNAHKKPFIGSTKIPFEYVEQLKIRSSER